MKDGMAKLQLRQIPIQVGTTDGHGFERQVKVTIAAQ